MSNSKKQESSPAIEGIGTKSGQVMTVLGPIPVEELGITLTHEHILSDVGCNGPEPPEASRKGLFRKPLTMDILGDVRLLPQCNRDNQCLTDIDLAASEVEKYRHWGGRTIVEVTLDGIGRDPVGLQMVSLRTGVQIVMGAGYYIEFSQPPELRKMTPDDIADEIVRDLTEGVPGTGVRAGFIGEIGIDMDFTAEEEKSLRGAARAARRTEVPLSIHVPGGSMRSHEYRTRIMDIVEEEGASLEHTIIDHVEIHPTSFENQISILERGAFVGYDGISSGFDWGLRGIGADDEEYATDIKRLIEEGYLHRILLSQDVHLKIMLTAYGGFGYAYILKCFVQRLRSHGVTEEQITTMLVENPRRLFSSRYRHEKQ
jgi:phosphotriesterase-related protein